jgi:hypothetical protein
MKKIIAAAVLVMAPAFAFAGDVKVGGYWADTNRDGVKDTYVQPHERTAPNQTRTDNYGYPGNYNPNTGMTTPQSNSPAEMYPRNPSPYGSHKKSTW